LGVRLEPVDLGRPREASDECRRYRVVEISFDLTVRTLTEEAGDDWEEPIRQQWFSNQALIREGLLHQFGVADSDRKISDYIALDVAPLSIVSTHNDLLSQCRHAFVAGQYYPALLGAAGLGERILNELILQLRDDYKSSPHYKNVYRKGSIDDWDFAVKVLLDWAVIDVATSSLFQRLKQLRNESVHYQNHTLHVSARDEALEAIQLLQQIVEKVFSPWAVAPQYVMHPSGIAFLTLEAEQIPLLRHVFIPRCALVSPRHEFSFVGQAGHVMIQDDVEWVLDNPDAVDLTDAQFAASFEAQTQSTPPR
jgi:hypothetical protein